MIINKGKFLYKFHPVWMKKEPVKSKPNINKKNDDIVEEQPWINQNIKWNFSLSMPRWMWILLSLFLISLVFLIN
jgi:hypothetical protein